MNIDWHERFIQQARWTKTIRDYLLDSLEIAHPAAVLEIGCGTGVVLSDLVNKVKPFTSCGIDLDFNRLSIATRNNNNLLFGNADAALLPFPGSSFDLVFCHYLVLWLQDPLEIFREAYRVLKSDGYLIAFAEPDYENRVDTPQQLSNLGVLQTQSLRSQGADPGVGKFLAGWMAASGFQLLKFGVPGYEHPKPGIPAWWESEWQVLDYDLSHLLSQEDLYHYKSLDRQSWLSGNRVLWIPTYYALGRKP